MQQTASITNQGNLVTGKDLTLSAGNLDLQGTLQAGGNLILQAQDTLKVRDSASNPFIASAGGNLLVQGNQKVDIFALNNLNSGFFSGGDMVLRSSNTVGGDAHYWAGGNFRIEQLNGDLGNLFSPDDPVILATGDVSFGSYTGASLHILAGGSVNISGDITINGVDSKSNSIKETVTLSDGTTKIDIEQAIAILQKTPNSPQRLPVWAQVWDVKASLELARGKAEAAVSSWETAASIYQQLQDSNKTILAQVNQAQALQTLGLYRREISLLRNLTTSVAKQPDSLAKATSFRNLGEALVLTGDLKQAEANLQTSLKIAQQLRSPEATASAYLSLGNLAYLPGSSTEQQNIALDYYQKAAVTSTTATTKIPAQLNRLRLLIELEQWPAAQALYPQIQHQIANLPLGRSAIYAQVNLAQSLLELRMKFPNLSLETIAKILAVARQQAQQLQDARAESFVLGNLGHLYELSQQWSIAQDLTRKALNLSESIQAPDIAYRWQWQLGRILCQGKSQCEQQGEITGAIAAYKEVFNTLQNIRSDLLATNKNVQFSLSATCRSGNGNLV